MASSAQTLERQLDTLWDECRAQNSRRVEDMDADITARVGHDLEQMRRAVEQRATGSHTDVQQQLASVAALSKQFEASAAAWRGAAQVAMREIAQEQQQLARLVDEAARTMAANKEELHRRQHQRLAGLEQQCAHVVDTVASRYTPRGQ